MEQTDFLQQLQTIITSKPGLKGCQQLNQDLTPFSSPGTLLAIIKSVTAEGKTSRNASTKCIQLQDPSGKITITSDDKLQLEPGNILRVSNLLKTFNASTMTVSYTCQTNGTGRLQQINTFAFDYESREPKAFEERFFPEDTHREVCQVLESWQANNLLSWNFSQLTPVKSKIYVDFVCEVICQRTTRRNVNLIVWDGCQPGVEVRDQFAPQYAHHIPEFKGEYQRCDQSLIDLVQDKVVHVCVWMNESHAAIDHFATCCKVIPGDKAYLVLFNVEVASCGFNHVMLSMRSGHHQGKAVRVVSPSSILGRLLTSRLEDAAFDLMESQVIQESSKEVSMKESVDTRETSPKNPNKSQGEQLFKLLPPHITYNSLMNLTISEIDSYQEILSDADSVNFQEYELGPYLSPEKMIEILSEVKRIKMNSSPLSSSSSQTNECKWS